MPLAARRGQSNLMGRKYGPVGLLKVLANDAGPIVIRMIGSHGGRLVICRPHDGNIDLFCSKTEAAYACE